MKSIDRSLQGAEYARLRIGVGPAPAEDDLADFVLERFDEKDEQTVGEMIPTLADAVECWIKDGVEVAMNRFNKRVEDSD